MLSLPQSGTRSRGLGWLGYLGALVLGSVLLFAVFSKAADPRLFEEQIVAEGLDFWLPAGIVAILALALEAALGFALILGIRRLWVLLPAAALVLFFLFLTGRTYVHELRGEPTPADSCGCFGHLVERTAAEAFWQDLVLLVPPLALSFLGRPRHTQGQPRARLAGAVAGTVAVLGLASSAYSLPLDDVVTRLRPGVALGDLCVDEICVLDLVPDAQDQSTYLVILDPEDERLGETIDALNAYVLDGEGPDLAVLTGATPEELNKLSWQFGPVFQILDAPSALLRPLYRTLPRAVWTLDGQVKETYNGLPPAVREMLSEDGP
jgi:uncharacterized membrane protein YphA (DoxX/SURF4 family)